MTTGTASGTLQLTRTVDTVDGFRVPVALSGPRQGRCIVMLDEEGRRGEVYDAVRDRLHIATLRTVAISSVPELTAKSVLHVLDYLRIDSALLVGDRAGGALAWSVAAAQQERFTGLVAIDAGHPRVPDMDCVVRDSDCPAVQIDTTALVSSNAARAVACASRRYVHGEFRLVDLAGPRTSRHFATQVTTEIVVRSLSR